MKESTRRNGLFSLWWEHRFFSLIVMQTKPSHRDQTSSKHPQLQHDSHGAALLQSTADSKLLPALSHTLQLITRQRQSPPCHHRDKSITSASRPPFLPCGGHQEELSAARIMQLQELQPWPPSLCDSACTAGPPPWRLPARGSPHTKLPLSALAAGSTTKTP